MENEDQKDFISRDISLVAALMSYKFKLTGMSYQIEGTRSLPVGYFHFEDTLPLQESTAKYFRGELLVEPREFMNNVRMLKTEVTSKFKAPR